MKIRKGTVPLGRAWIDGGWRYFYVSRQINRGRRKGWWELQYVGRPGPCGRRVQVPEKYIKWSPMEAILGLGREEVR